MEKNTLLGSWEKNSVHVVLKSLKGCIAFEKYETNKLIESYFFMIRRKQKVMFFYKQTENLIQNNKISGISRS